MKQRIVYLDLIKIIAAYLVIFTHTGDIGSKLYVYRDYELRRDIIYVAMDAFRTINVPLFFMVSGALLLGKKESYYQLFKKYILKYSIVLLFISYFYYTVFNDKNWYDIWDFFKNVYSGNVVGILWFLYAYLGYLLILPFIRMMICNMTKADYRYLLIMGILFKGVIDVAGRLIIDCSFGVPCELISDVFFYPIMGYYFANIIEATCDKRIIIKGAIASTICIICTVGMTYWDMSNTGEFSERFLFSFTVIPTLFMFYFIKILGTKIMKYPFICRVINMLGDSSFGVYLFGLYLQVRLIGIYFKISEILAAFPLLSCFLYVGSVVICAVLITQVLKRIPILGKYI